MIIYEFRLYGTQKQYQAVDECIKVSQFMRNKALRKWMDSKDSEQKVSCYSLNGISKILAKEFDFVKPLNSTARQAAIERAWNAIKRFYDKKSRYPKFQHDNRSVEFKKSGWKLSDDYKKLTITSCNVGTLKMKGTRNLQSFSTDKIKRVRLLRRADGYYVQFCINTKRKIKHIFTGKAVGIDVGLNSFLTDSDGEPVDNPRFLRKSEKRLKRFQRRFSKKEEGSENKKKARGKLSRLHLKVSRQRKDFAINTARQVITNSDFVGIEDLKVSNMVKNRKLAKSISDASWRAFRTWLEYFGEISGVRVVAVPPAYTSQMCSSCGAIVKKGLECRVHECSCGCVLDRDENAAKNILAKAYEAVGHTDS